MLPRGMRIRRARKPYWLAVAVFGAAGLPLGVAMGGESAAVATLGILVVVLTVAAAIYSPALGLALLAFTYPFDLTTKAGPLKLTTSQALIGILVLIWAGRQIIPSQAQGWRRTPLDVPVALFAAATGLTLLGLNGHTQEQLIGLTKALGGFVVFFLATQSLRSRRDVWLVMGAVLATGLIQAVTTALPVVSGEQLVSVYARATGTEIQANLFAGYLVLVIPLVIAVGLGLRHPVAVAAASVAAIVFAIALLATLSRSGWLGLIVGMGLLGWLLPRRRWHIAAIAASAVLLLLLMGLLASVGDRLAPNPLTGPGEMLASRWDVWIQAVVMMAQHPLFGVGVENFVFAYPQYSGSHLGLNHAHNLLLNIGAERGIPSLILFGYLLVVLFRVLISTWRRSATQLEGALVAGLIAAFAAYLVHSLLEVSYYDYKVLLLFWLLAGVAASLPRLLAADRIREPASLIGAVTPQPA
jgi:putative inorganic carbon (HCO3(-)) transporter